VEDNEINREIATALLSDAGLMVDIAENGKIACDLIARQGADYGLVLMDIQMPEMDGLAATRAIRREWTQQQLPIIALTAHAYEDEQQRCLDAGMNDHIAKPVDPVALVHTLEHWLRASTNATRALAKAEAEAEASVEEGANGDLPSTLAPFDLTAALGRVNGKAALLRRLIVTFGTTYADTAQDMDRFVRAGDFNGAQELAHKLKSVAGSLGLPTVQTLGADIEHALRHDQHEQALAMIAALQLAIAPALLAAQNLAGARNDNGVATMAARAGGSVELARAAFHDQLVRRSFTARAAFEAYASAKGLSTHQRDQHPISTALNALNYGLALELLDREPAGDAAPSHLD
jgi:CheY-like chemotaxis protein